MLKLLEVENYIKQAFLPTVIDEVPYFGYIRFRVFRLRICFNIWGYMKKILLVCTLIFCAFEFGFAKSAAWSGNTAKAFTSGSGTPVNPYLIATAEELVLMLTKAQDSVYFKLADDIVFNDGDASTWATKAPKYQWPIVGDTTKWSRARFNGNGHFISGIYINNDKSYQGFFGVFSGVIENLTLKNSFIKGNDYVGALAGVLFKGGEIRNTKVNAYVYGNDFVGGLVGSAGTPLYDDSFVANSNFNFYNVSMSGKVVGRNYVAGITGYATSSYSVASLVGFENYADVSGTIMVGGLAGKMYFDVPLDTIFVSFGKNLGRITGDSLVGGIAGLVISERSGPEDALIYTNLYNVGIITGTKRAGGLFGAATYSRITSSGIKLSNSYNGGDVIGASGWGSVDSLIYSGLLGVFDLNLDKKDSIVEYSDSLGPNFMPDTGAVKLNNGYPLLIYFMERPLFDKGSGTHEDPYLIESFAALFRFEKHVDANTKNGGFSFYKQTADIELPKNVANNWIPVDADSILYDGDGYSISNLSIEDSLKDTVGFFSKINHSQIKNLTFKNAKIKGNLYVGILAGYSESSFYENTKLYGTVSGAETTSRCVGGAFGSSDDWLYNIENYAAVSGKSAVGGISGCIGDPKFYFVRNYGSIKGSKSVGGIIGDAQNLDLRYSYNRGDVTGENEVGGLCGISRNGSFRYSYNASRVTGTGDSVGALVGLDFSSWTLDSSYFQNVYYDKSLSVIPPLGKGASTLKTLVSVKGLLTSAMIGSSLLDSLYHGFTEDVNDENDGYPVPNFWKGDGTEKSPYLIEDSEDLWYLSVFENDLKATSEKTYFEVTKDIAMKTDSIHPWIPISSKSRFEGVFDGGNYTISGLYVNTAYAGLFGISNGIIKNVGIANSTIKGNSAGAIVGLNTNAVELSWNKNASIYGKNSAGGLAGINRHNALDLDSNITYVNQVYNGGTVTGKYVGGIVGSLEMGESPWNIPDKVVIVSNSYNRGKVLALDSSAYMGGIIGYVSRNHNIQDASSAYFIQIHNTYNTEDICSAADVYDCGELVGYVGGYSQLKNNYYLENGDQELKPFGLNFYLALSDSLGRSKTEKEMKSMDFVSLLGEAFNYDSQGVNDGYPIFSGKPGLINGIKARNVKTPLVFKTLNAKVVGREIRLDNVVNGSKVSVFDVRGKVVWTGVAAGPSLSIPMNNPGIYLVKNKYQTARVRIR